MFICWYPKIIKAKKNTIYFLAKPYTFSALLQYHSKLFGWQKVLIFPLQKVYNVTDEEMKKCSQNARNFLAALIDLVGSDVSAVVDEKEGEKVVGE